MKKLLYVDDQRYMHQLLRSCVNDAGCEFTAVTSVQQAIESLVMSHYDILITDISVGDDDGLGLVRMVRCNPKLSGVPVIVLSMFDDKEHIVKAKDCGADDYIVKPFEMKRVSGAIKRWLTAASDDIDWTSLSPEQARLTRLTIATLGQAFSSARRGAQIPHRMVRENCLSILKAAHDGGIATALGSLKDCDAKVYLHSVKVSAYLGMMSSTLGTKGEDILDIVTAGLLHDIGVTKIPRSFLEKEDWSKEELKWFAKAHVDFSAEIIHSQKEPFTELSKSVMTMHHERLDGTGPWKRTAAAIPEFARMAAVIEEFLSQRDGLHTDGHRPAAVFDTMERDPGLDQRFVALMKQIQGHGGMSNH